MKKLILGLMLSLISIATFACHINPLGECSGNSYFVTKLFNPNSQYVFKTAAGDTLLIFKTGPTIIDSIFSLPLPVNTAVYMDYNYIGSDYIEYYTNTSASNDYSGCGALGVTLTNLKIQNGFATFSAGEEIGIDHYNVQGSFDSKNWVTIGTKKADGERSYKIPITEGSAAAAIFLSLVFLPNKKKWLSFLSIFFILAFYSCKKEVIQSPKTTYKYYHIQTVDVSGVVVDSDVKIVKP